MNLKDKLEDHFQRLINEGEIILKKYGWSNGVRGSQISYIEYNKWYSSAKNLIRKACNEGGIHYKQIEYA